MKHEESTSTKTLCVGIMMNCTPRNNVYRKKGGTIIKKKIIIFASIALAFVLILFVPYRRDAFNDGGTVVYDALAYKVVSWHVGLDDDAYKNTSVYWYPDNLRDEGELWEMELSGMLSFVEPTLQLKQKYPEYFNLGTFKGLEVYIWQTSSGEYLCGVLQGTNRNKTDEEIAKLAENGATVEEMKVILSYYNIDKESIIIIPVKNPSSNYEIDFSMFDTAKEIFWG